MNLLSKRTICFVVLFALQGFVQAEVMRQPPDLGIGEPYRLAFVTSTSHTAQSSDVADYDGFVQATANAAPIVGEWGLDWRAIVSTESVDARDHVDAHPENDAGVPIYLLDGSLLVSRSEFLWRDIVGNNTPDKNRFDFTELGEHLVDRETNFVYVWTGTGFDGTRSGRSTSRVLGDDHATVGVANSFFQEWFAGASRRTTFGAQHRLYALSDVLTAVPEPTFETSLILAMIVSVARLRRRGEGGVSAL